MITRTPSPITPRRRVLVAFAALLLALPIILSLIAWLALPAAAPDAPRVLLSLDATPWNRVGMSRFTYQRALRRAGLEPVVVRFDHLPPNADPAALLDAVDGVVLSGGGDVDPTLYGGEARIGLDVKPRRDRLELALLEAAEGRRLPVLGICRGAQLMNVARGGSLLSFRADRERFARHRRRFGSHPVELDGDSMLARIYGRQRLERVTTFHGQAVDEPGAGVRPVARAPDGTIEAFEIAGDRFQIGVQWHAETEFGDTPQQRLFDAFAEAVVRRADAVPRPDGSRGTGQGQGEATSVRDAPAGPTEKPSARISPLPSSSTPKRK